jgi:hypothetical protein
MGLMSRLGIEYTGMLFFIVFYLVVAVVNFVILGVYGLALFHVSLVAVLSLLAAFGLYRLRRWSLWLVVGLFFIATTYGATMLSATLGEYSGSMDIGVLFGVLVWIVYLVLTWVATIYVVARRKSLSG